MITAARPIALAAALWLSLIEPLTGDERSLGGLLEEPKGEVFLKEKGGDERQLDNDRDHARPLYAGDVVRCGSGGSVTIWLPAGPPKVLKAGESVTIEPVKPRKPAVPADKRPERQKALETYGTPGGRDRGSKVIYCPAVGSRVRPGQFRIAWLAGPEMGTISFTLETGSGKRLWSQAGVNGPEGEYVSAEARRALERYRAEGSEELTITLTEARRGSNSVTFALLSAEEERAIDRQLGEWNTEASRLIRHIGRAYVLAENRMFTDVAEEYEAALRDTPKSRSLLEAAIEAHWRTGNMWRVNELEDRLR